MDSFRRFDDFIIERVLQPVCERLYARWGISNYRLAGWLCSLVMLCDWFDIYQQAMQFQLGNMMIDLFVLPIVVGVYTRARREDGHPPGTMSVFRANYVGRYIVLLGNIAICFMLTSRVWTTPVMSNLLLLIYYLIACDKPKGDRVGARGVYGAH